MSHGDEVGDRPGVGEVQGVAGELVRIQAALR